MPVQNPFHIWAEEARGVLPFDSAGRIEKWYLDRFQSILAQFNDVHPNAYTLSHYRAAFNSLEKSLAQEREGARLKSEADAEATRLKDTEDARWSRRIKRAANFLFISVPSVLRSGLAVVKRQRW
jgi:hypothetical protein